MGSAKSSFFIWILMLFSSCLSLDIESVNNGIISNNTKDTLIFSVITRHLCPNCQPAAENPYLLPPNDFAIITADAKKHPFEQIDEYCGSYLDTVVVYAITNDTLNSENRFNLYGNGYIYVIPLVRWGGPLLDLSDSVHSFYNKNSWVIEKNPNSKKQKKTTATFTIYGEDLQ